MAKICDGCDASSTDELLYDVVITVTSVGYEKVTPLNRDLCGKCIDRLAIDADPTTWPRKKRRPRSSAAQGKGKV